MEGKGEKNAKEKRERCRERKRGEWRERKEKEDGIRLKGKKYEGEKVKKVCLTAILLFGNTNAAFKEPGVSPHRGSAQVEFHSPVVSFLVGDI